MTIAFSHPAVSGIVMWQVWGGAGHNRVLWNPDWSIKPAGEAWLDLVFNQWWTYVPGYTGTDGSFRTRGFLGDYEITVQVGDQIKTVRSQLTSAGSGIDFVFDN